jgi:hypothetical protein
LQLKIRQTVFTLHLKKQRRHGRWVILKVLLWGALWIWIAME